jgi:hypothetical protein
MFTSVTCYIVQVIPIYLARMLLTNPDWHVPFDVIVLNILRRAMAYVASVGSNLDCLRRESLVF